MNKPDRLARCFEEDKQNILSVFLTAGYPDLEDAPVICRELSACGVDLIELGFPYSDSLVDGPTIQQSNEKALSNGMTLERYFAQAAVIRKDSEVPLIFMSCINPVLQYGVERFCKSCMESGIDGAIIPDLPSSDYKKHFQQIFEEHGLSIIFLITSRTPETRIREYDELSNGFLYAVSSEATTGSCLEVDKERKQYFDRLAQLKLKNPVLIGFGISNEETFRQASECARGAIIGSAFIRALDGPGSINERVRKFVNKIRPNTTPE